MVGWYFSASGVYNSHGDGVLGGSGGSRWSAGIFQRQGCIIATVRRCVGNALLFLLFYAILSHSQSF